jgi:methionine-rich copper-binding protein CopC
VSSDIVITFSEKIQKGIGSIYLKRADGTIVAAYNVASSANLSVLDSILTINPTVDLVSNTGYRVELAAGTIKDMAGNSYTGTTSYNFTTAAPVDTEVPTVVVFYPTDNSTGIPLDNDIVVTFDEAIQRGIGDIILKKADGTVVATYNAATSANLKFSGSTLTIDPSSNFAAGTGYKVEFAAGTVKDLSDNSYAGTTSYNFTTAGITVNGTSTNDILQGSWGDDTISGGDGSDVFSVQGLPSQYTMVDTILAGIEGSDTLNSIEYIRFGAGLGADHFITDLTSFSLIDPDGSGPEASPAQKLLEQISDLYVAYFNRAPDVAGISYWFREVFNGSWTLDKIAASFTEQAEYLATYPPDMSNRDFIKTIYQNLFDRDPDAAGWDYWEGDLNGGAARDTFILAVINGAYAPSGGADDRALLNNKHDVSLYYTEQLLLYPLEGLDQNIDTVLNRVSSDPATVAKAMEVIDYIMEQPVSLTGLLQDVAAWENLWA